ncbi:MAG TPA: DUF423 domain-containing protein [Gemmatimonadales bacterium]|nr:DUF423 domain-containing protein [Gemmatimonadales bacterium]
MNSPRAIGVLGGLCGGLAVLAGAFGAHGLRGRLSPDLLSVFETAARYQMYHALALVAVALLLERRPSTPLRVAGWCFAGGTVVFSGSLYLLALTGTGWWGAVTPLGGLALLVGWGFLAYGLWRN